MPSGPYYRNVGRALGWPADVVRQLEAANRDASSSATFASIEGSPAENTALAAALNAKLSDAPSDGSVYGRLDGAWTVVIPPAQLAWYVAAVENTDNTTDLSGSGVPVPLAGATVHIDAAEYSISGNGVEVTTAGRHRVSAVVDSTGDAITLQFAVNGTATGPVGTSTITAILDLAANDIVTVEAFGASNPTTLTAGTSSLTIETWR